MQAVKPNLRARKRESSVDPESAKELDSREKKLRLRLLTLAIGSRHGSEVFTGDGFSYGKSQQHRGGERAQTDHRERNRIADLLGGKAEQRRANQPAELAGQAPKTEEPPARVGRRHVRAEHLHASRRNRSSRPVNPPRAMRAR
jgi:hypothetical protein